MRNYDPYEESAFDGSFSEDDLWQAVYDDTPVYAVSVLNPIRYRQTVAVTEKIKTALDAELLFLGETAEYDLEFDRQLGLDLCFSIRLPNEGLFLSTGVISELLKNAPTFDFSITPLPWDHIRVCFIFKNVKTVLEQQ